ncbi:MAG: ABC transporter permease [Mesorhizobium sp.]|nr:MAG: ABC transporter permease [Mesorhizobium sp.]
MISAALRQIMSASVILLLAMTCLVLIIHLVPGDPATTLLGPRATEASKAALRSQMGFDDPIPVQVFSFILKVLHGDLGIDVISRRPISAIVLGQLPYTMTLIGVSILLAACIGIPLGCYSALHRNGSVDNLIGVLSIAAIAMPSFVIAIYCVLLFSITLKVLPAIGVGRQSDMLDQIIHLVLPALAIGLNWVGYLARFIRSSLLEVLGERHIQSARAHGLTESRILFSYALPLAILPTVTVIGVSVGPLISAAVLTEIVFARPGIGKLMFDSIAQRNYPVVMAVVLVTTVLLVVCTTIADLLNGLIDPRVRHRS